MSVVVSVVELRPGQTGRVTAISGGFGTVRRLNALGIYEGQLITKVGAQWMRGPVIVRVGSTDVALGYGMASRIMVVLTGESPP